MPPNDPSYFRLVSSPRRRLFGFVADPEYLVLSPESEPKRVRLRDLPVALGVLPGGSRRDWQECEMIATALYEEGETAKWVEYPTGRVCNDSQLHR